MKRKLRHDAVKLSLLKRRARMDNRNATALANRLDRWDRIQLRKDEKTKAKSS